MPIQGPSQPAYNCYMVIPTWRNGACSVDRSASNCYVHFVVLMNNSMLQDCSLAYVR